MTIFHSLRSHTKDVTGTFRQMASVWYIPPTCRNPKHTSSTAWTDPTVDTSQHHEPWHASDTHELSHP